MHRCIDRKKRTEVTCERGERGMQWAKMIRNQHSRNQRESNDVNPVVPAPSWAWSGRCRTDICWTVQLPGNFGVIPLMHQSHANAFSCKFHITGTCIHVSKRAAHSTLAEDGCHEDLGPASLAQLSSLRGRDDVSKDWVLTVDPLVPDPVLLSSTRYGLKWDCSAAPTGTSTYADAKPASWK